MDTKRFGRMTVIAGTALCLVAISAQAQDTSVATPPTTGVGAQPGTVAPLDTMGGPIGMTQTPADVDDDGRGFPWGLLGLLGLLGLMKRGGTTTVTRDTYTPPPDTRPRNVGTGTATDDRTMNLNPRPGGTNDPNARR